MEWLQKVKRNTIQIIKELYPLASLYRIMTIKEFTESAIKAYLEKGGSVNPHITLDIFQLI